MRTQVSLYSCTCLPSSQLPTGYTTLSPSLAQEEIRKVRNIQTVILHFRELLQYHLRVALECQLEMRLKGGCKIGGLILG